MVESPERSVNGGDIGGLGAERTAVMETNGAGSAHRYDDPGDIGEAGVRGERGTELVHIVGGKARAQKAVNFGQVRLNQLRLDLGLERSSSEAPEVSSSTLAPAFSAMPVILA